MWQRKRLDAGLWLLAAVFFLLRFIHLSADYPHWMRWDDGIATDEGWYASAAIDHQLWGNWRLPGDMNIPVLMPVWSGVLSVVFRLFGFGIVQARATAVVFFLGCAFLSILLLRRYGGQRWTALYAAMLACNPWAFTFSRSAFLEFPMLFFFLLAAVVAGGPEAERNEQPLWRAFAAGAFFGVAMLTKTTALPLVLPLLYVVAQRHSFQLRRYLPCATTLLIVAGAVYGTGWSLLAKRFPEDVRFYLNVVPSAFHLTLRGIVADGSRPFRYGVGSDHLLFALTLLVVLLSAMLPPVRRLWREPLFALPAIWVAAFLALMVEHNNDPARYFAVTIPAVLMVGIALLQHTKGTRPRLHRVLLMLIVADVGVNTAQVCLFVATTRDTFQTAALAMRTIVEKDADGNRVVLADNAHELALYTGLRPLNILFHSAPITGQVDRYQPGWWVQFQPQDNGDCFRSSLSAGYTAEKQGTWQAFYPGSTLTLWKLRRSGSLPASLSEEQRRACLPIIQDGSAHPATVPQS